MTETAIYCTGFTARSTKFGSWIMLNDQLWWIKVCPWHFPKKIPYLLFIISVPANWGYRDTQILTANPTRARTCSARKRPGAKTEPRPEFLSGLKPIWRGPKRSTKKMNGSPSQLTNNWHASMSWRVVMNGPEFWTAKIWKRKHGSFF